MFKKLILIFLAISLLVIPFSACSKPSADNAKAIAPENTPTTKIPAEQPTEKTTEQPKEKPVTVAEFIKKSLKNKYEQGDIITISGIIADADIRNPRNVNPWTGRMVNVIILGPGTDGYTVTISSEGVRAETNLEEGYESFMSMTKAEKGDTVVIRASYGYDGSYNDLHTIILLDASVIQ
ncbi:MAG: hypothetical protein ABIA08_01125 [bacterium]